MQYGLTFYFLSVSQQKIHQPHSKVFSMHIQVENNCIHKSYWRKERKNFIFGWQKSAHCGTVSLMDYKFFSLSPSRVNGKKNSINRTAHRNFFFFAASLSLFSDRVFVPSNGLTSIRLFPFLLLYTLKLPRNEFLCICI